MSQNVNYLSNSFHRNSCYDQNTDYIRNDFHGNGWKGSLTTIAVVLLWRCHEVMGVILIQPIKFIFSRCLSCHLFTYYQVTKLFRNPTNRSNIDIDVQYSLSGKTNGNTVPSVENLNFFQILQYFI